ncbi:hypothetical protein DITRI_Ditri07aG0155800 [Diplodiscus trichospermus]
MHQSNDRETGRSRGFGFITFRNEKAMRDAIEGMNEQNLDGRNIIVNEAYPARAVVAAKEEETTGTTAVVEMDMVVIVKEATVEGAMRVDMAMEEDMEADAVRVDTVMVDLVTRDVAVPQMEAGCLRFKL